MQQRLHSGEFHKKDSPYRQWDPQPTRTDPVMQIHHLPHQGNHLWDRLDESPFESDPEFSDPVRA